SRCGAHRARWKVVRVNRLGTDTSSAANSRRGLAVGRAKARPGKQGTSRCRRHSPLEQLLFPGADRERESAILPNSGRTSDPGWFEFQTGDSVPAQCRPALVAAK